MHAARRAAARVPTIERQSIRESLRIFARVTSENLPAAGSRTPDNDKTQSHSKQNVGTSFEDMCAGTNVSGATHVNAHVSCGNTMQCFASLFMPPTGWRMAHLLDGGMLWQLSSNANVVVYSWRVHVSMRIRSALGLPGYSCVERDQFSRRAQAVGRWSSSRSLDHLEQALLQADEPRHLPRVFFCSLTWLTPGFRDSLVPLPDDDDTEIEATSSVAAAATRRLMLNSGGALGAHTGLLLDHKFSIIKHDNNCFQMVQGYMAHDADDGGAADAKEYLRQLVAETASAGALPSAVYGRFSTAGFTPGNGCDGFGLIGWKKSLSGAKFGIRFKRALMIASLLPSLRGFAVNDTFDAEGYAPFCFAATCIPFGRTCMAKLA